MSREEISNRQLWFVLFMMRVTIIVAFLPVVTSANALQDAWLSAIVTFIVTELVVLLISLLNTRFPDLTIIEYSQELLGKYLGKVLSLFFLWLFLQLSIVEIYMYGEVITTNFLPETPIIFIVATMVVAAASSIYLGVETLAKIADLVFIIFVIMIIGIIIVPLDDINLYNLQPVLVRGWKPVIRGAVMPIALTSQIWILGMFSPLTTKAEEVTKTALTAVGAALIVLIIITLLTVTVLGPYIAAKSSFPLLNLMRSAQITKFLQRTEVLLMFAWGFGLFISVSAYLYCGAKGIQQFLALEDYRSLVWPMSLIWIFMSKNGFKSIFELNQYSSPKVFGLYGMIVIVLPLAILWLSYFVKRRL